MPRPTEVTETVLLSLRSEYEAGAGDGSVPKSIRELFLRMPGYFEDAIAPEMWLRSRLQEIGVDDSEIRQIHFVFSRNANSGHDPWAIAERVIADRASASAGLE